MKKSDEYRNFLEFANHVVDFSYSQKLQDLWGLWENRSIEKGYFVEFGALSGINVSNSYLMELLGWDGIVAEPHPNYREILKKNRNCNICYDAVYSITGKELVFKAVVGSPALSTLELSLPDDRQKKKRENAQDYIVKTISLNDLLGQFNAPSIIDFISIDTEGSELEILSTFDFTKYQFRSICIEYGTEEKRKKIFEILTKQGYVRKWQKLSEHDDWYVNQKICNPAYGELKLISKIRNLKPDFTFAASREKKKKQIEKLLEKTPINLGQVKKEKYRRCAIFQFEAVHEAVIPTLVYVFNQNGYIPHIYINARCESQRGDIFSQMSALDFELYYWKIDNRQDWEELTEKARHQDIEFICLSTFQSDGIAKWADQVGKPIIGVIHNVNLFLASEHCHKVFASGKLQVLTLGHHVAVFLHQRIDKELTDRVGVIEPVFWGGNFGENRTSLNQEKIVAIPGGVNFKTREYSTLLAVLEDQGLRKDINGLVFKVLGGGSDRTILEQEVAERGLESHILFAPLSPSGMVLYKDYFTALQSATFLYPLAPLSFYHYREHKITSAITTALGFNLPIVLDRWTARTYRVPALVSDATVAASVACLVAVEETEITAKRQAMIDYYHASLMEGTEELKRIICAIA
ncbi:MAG: FkbM family methyltransferase [Microcoleaceae cyanobacterium MO_207.B10]|nr:FkbM family methyltransferase [Microcoleaceae cyanobacterium MO_207.B10]